MFKITFAVVVQPDRFTTEVTGTGPSPETARKDAERQISSHIAQARLTDARAVVTSTTVINSDYENTPAPTPRMAIRNPNRAKALPGGATNGTWVIIRGMLASMGRKLRSLLPA